ncbi:DUF4328 domain-containing protein [Wenjunlia tyrosinilytica]|uniref:DUF4328 domain-containing protein n=1 Tax=Wenjunlia tyrosinilytica TaxID=1544741 RepID=UPI001664F1B0|nr:DUF4328 domain-containing protein [Wenjunlia tyrosinilytica]
MAPAYAAPVLGLGTAASVMMWVMAGLGGLVVIADIKVYNAVDEALGNPFLAQYYLDGSLKGFYRTASTLYGLGFLASAAVFLTWFHRVRVNAEAWAPTGHRFSRGWAVGAWFVPVANLWFPKQIADDIHAASDPSPPSPFRRPGAGMLNGWWTALVGGWALGVVGYITIGAADDDADVNGFQTGLLFLILGSMANVAAAVLAALVVRRISETQDVRLGVAAPRRAYAPSPYIPQPPGPPPFQPSPYPPSPYPPPGHQPPAYPPGAAPPRPSPPPAPPQPAPPQPARPQPAPPGPAAEPTPPRRPTAPAQAPQPDAAPAPPPSLTKE